MIVTALLVSWTGGWHDVTDAGAVARWGRKEAMLGLGAVEELSEVETVSREQLVTFGDPLTEISCDTFPVGEPDTPYVGYRPGDMVTVPGRAGNPPLAERVQSITATMDDDGRVTYATELRDVLMDDRERFAENLTKLANGSIGGYSKVAQPTSMAPSRERRSTLEPQEGGAGFTATSLAPQSTTWDSAVLRSLPPGDGDYTLTSFWCRPETDGDRSDNPVVLQLWQNVPGGDGNHEVAYVSIGNDFQAGVEYAGFIFDNAITFGPEWGIHFRVSNGRDQMTGDVYVAAEFEGGGTIITVEWERPTLRVSQRPQGAPDV